MNAPGVRSEITANEGKLSAFEQKKGFPCKLSLLSKSA